MDKIFKIASMVSSLISLTQWTEASSRKVFARVCILINMRKLIYRGAKVQAKSNMIWQPFVYKELLDIC